VKCHDAYMREWRKIHKLSKVARKKMICRSYANAYQRRGKFKKGKCIFCQNNEVEKHHPDYDKPLVFDWICKRHHLLLTKLLKLIDKYCKTPLTNG
jgi:uncharacterized membrane protein YcjF (UPF0283 family)